MSAILPWLSFCVNLKSEGSIEFNNKSVASTSYSITKSEHAYIDFEEYSLTDEFIYDVKSTVDSKLNLISLKI